MSNFEILKFWRVVWSSCVEVWIFGNTIECIWLLKPKSVILSLIKREMHCFSNKEMEQHNFYEKGPWKVSFSLIKHNWLDESHYRCFTVFIQKQRRNTIKRELSTIWLKTVYIFFLFLKNSFLSYLKINFNFLKTSFFFLSSFFCFSFSEIHLSGFSAMKYLYHS